MTVVIVSLVITFVTTPTIADNMPFKYSVSFPDHSLLEIVDRIKLPAAWSELKTDHTQTTPVARY